MTKPVHVQSGLIAVNRSDRPEADVGLAIAGIS